MSENKACCQNDKGLPKIREAVCIDTNRVYDSCADKDCLADLRVYFPPQCQEIVEHATNVRCRGKRCPSTAAVTAWTSPFSLR